MVAGWLTPALSTIERAKSAGRLVPLLSLTTLSINVSDVTAMRSVMMQDLISPPLTVPVQSGENDALYPATSSCVTL